MKMNIKCLSNLIYIICFLTFTFSCTNSNHKNEQIDGIESILSKNSVVKKIDVDYNFDTAGSPLYMDGVLYFTNNNFDSPDQLSRTFRMDQEGNIDTLVTGNNVTTTLRASRNGTIYSCQMLGHQVVELNTKGEIINVIANEFNGIRIDGPNDIVVDKKGGLYFSDSQFIAGRERMQPKPAVYYVSPEGELTKVIDDLEFPNGLGLSPDGGTLYVANTPGTQILAYDVAEDGTVNNGRDFAAVELAEDSETSGADGMAVDSEGNLFVATTLGLGVQIFNCSGEHLGNIDVPTPSNNVSFGGPDGKTLYISAQDGIYQISINTGI